MISTSTSADAADILTVIADLSNDEVFTPPRVADLVLDCLPPGVWTDPGLRWLDPGCKTGVFLRNAAQRLMTGLEPVIPDETERRHHILTNMLHGVAVTELTALMSRRTLYSSKDAAGPYSDAPFTDSAFTEKFLSTLHGPQNTVIARCFVTDHLGGAFRLCLPFCSSSRFSGFFRGFLGSLSGSCPSFLLFSPMEKIYLIITETASFQSSSIVPGFIFSTFSQGLNHFVLYCVPFFPDCTWS